MSSVVESGQKLEKKSMRGEPGRKENKRRKLKSDKCGEK